MEQFVASYVKNGLERICNKTFSSPNFVFKPTRRIPSTFIKYNSSTINKGEHDATSQTNAKYQIRLFSQATRHNPDKPDFYVMGYSLYERNYSQCLFSSTDICEDNNNTIILSKKPYYVRGSLEVQRWFDVDDIEHIRSLLQNADVFCIKINGHCVDIDYIKRLYYFEVGCLCSKIARFSHVIVHPLTGPHMYNLLKDTTSASSSSSISV